VPWGTPCTIPPNQRLRKAQKPDKQLAGFLSGSATFTEDGDGKPLWVVAGSGQNGIRKITYGVVPSDPRYAGPQQRHAPGNKKPDDIRGKEVRIQVHYRSVNPFGPAVEIYGTKVEVCQE
jgi:hypothetical protein